MIVMWCAPVMRKAQHLRGQKKPHFYTASRTFDGFFISGAHHGPKG